MRGQEIGIPEGQGQDPPYPNTIGILLHETNQISHDRLFELVKLHRAKLRKNTGHF